MKVIRIEFRSDVKERLLEILGCFSSDELKIIFKDPDFDENKRRLHATYAKLKSGTTKLYTLEEVDEMLEKTISQFED
ncbi:hypothetical protein C8C83_5588 [Flavobacterium sp. 90]|uniref:hypothetical protein n=1 Tax=unclassified Flavobacterium TaxID=196869 RepID=UPI000EB4B126|nr:MULTISPECIES: hypothetical protein [unclassified Flavobacterium]RKR08350.1 hypothetical protein C8C82_0219 [Flavobacterium sp. 81]TCK57538.1 hypothetical protein C8C83_5588 [Flavobacterium sp. 90]